MKLKITIEGAQGSGKTYVATRIKEALENDQWLRQYLKCKAIIVCEDEQLDAPLMHKLQHTSDILILTKIL